MNQSIPATAMGPDAKHDPDPPRGRAPRPSPRSRWAAPLLILFCVALAYGNSLNGPFIFDDLPGIRENPQVRQLFPPPSPHQTTVSGRPILRLSFLLNYLVSGNDVAAYHLTNLLIHLSAALLLFGIVRRNLANTRFWGNRFQASAPWLAAIVAAAWAVHPLTTAAVTYTVQRAESLASVFYLATLYCAIRTGEKPSSSTVWPVAAVIACAMGVATKEICITAPLVVLIYDRTFLAGSFTNAFRQRWPFYASLAAAAAVVFFALSFGSRSVTVGSSHGISSMDYARTQLGVIAHDLHLAVDPRGLSLDYHDWPIARRWAAVPWQGYAVAALLLLSLLALWLKPWLGFLGVWFFIILAPSSSVVPIYTEITADQRMYLPLAAFVAGAVVGGWSIARRWQSSRYAAAIVIAAIMVIFIYVTHQRNEQYADETVIWRDAAEKYPRNARAFANLGNVYLARSAAFPDGSPAAVSDARQAAQNFQAALSRDDYADGWLRLGQSLARSGDTTRAQAVFAYAIAHYPQVALDCRINRGTLRMSQNDFRAAIEDFRAAVAMAPDNPQPHYLLARADAALGDLPDAQTEYAKTLQLAPAYLDAAERLSRIHSTPKPAGP